MTAAYQPALDPGELRAAADTLDANRRVVSARATAATDAIGLLTATGFAGPTAALAYAQLRQIAQALADNEEALASMARSMRVAAEAQQAIDLAARVAIALRQQRTILMLNAASVLLDSELARQLNRARATGFERLAANPDADLAELSARHLPTLPPITRDAVRDAGAVVLEAGPGSATVMVGDVEDPSRIITMVAGATTGRPEDFPAELEKAQRIAERTGAAVVVWQGYQPPVSVGTALSPASATEGANHLSVFQAALEERYPDAEKTVVAHSYGTLVATRAASQHGLLADDLWLLGSPGVDGRSVDDLALAGPDSQVYVVDADEDPILHLRSGGYGVLGGASPSSPAYGANVIEGVSGDHSAYFTDEAFLTALSQPPAKNQVISVPSAGAREER